MNRVERESFDDENIIDHPSFRMASAPEPRDAEMQTIELQETPAADGPPVLSGPNVITSQPPRGEQRQRRPIQISSMDWMSTPRSEFTAFSGSHFLANLEQLELQQIIDLSTLLGRSERGCQYRVKIPQAETVFLAMETSDDGRTSFLGCSKIYHPNLSLSVLDQCGETAFVMKISARWTYTLQRLHQITVESATPFGSVEENFSVLGPSFTVYDEMHRPLCHISGPKICGCCMYKEAQFQVVSTDGAYQIASLMHQWDNATHDYTTLVTFPLDTDIKLKSLLLGASLLVEYLYYFRLRRTRNL